MAQLLIARAKKYKNMLVFDNKLSTYEYYHNGKLIWSVKGDNSLNEIAEKLFACNHLDTDLLEQEKNHPIFKKYYESCTQMVHKEWGRI